MNMENFVGGKGEAGLAWEEAGILQTRWALEGLRYASPPRSSSSSAQREKELCPTRTCPRGNEATGAPAGLRKEPPPPRFVFHTSTSTCRPPHSPARAVSVPVPVPMLQPCLREEGEAGTGKKGHGAS